MSTLNCNESEVTLPILETSRFTKFLEITEEENARIYLNHVLPDISTEEIRNVVLDYLLSGSLDLAAYSVVNYKILDILKMNSALDRQAINFFLFLRSRATYDSNELSQYGLLMHIAARTEDLEFFYDFLLQLKYPLPCPL
jgi:hypothetical protein